MADRALTLMAVHAHPDDEATGTGGTLARYAAEGIQTIVVTCTDGACGDGPGGVKPGQPGHDPEAVASMRSAELRASCAVLDVSHVELLGYRDSGMMGWATNDVPDSFWRTPVAVAAARLAELMRSYRPDVVVTYDENGFYGHPDHIQANRVTMAAIGLADLRPKVYWTTLPRSTITRFEQMMNEFDSNWNAEQNRQPGEEPMPEIGLPDEEISAWLDVSSYGSQKFDALAAHASQSENIFFLRMGKQRFTDVMGVETYVRVQDHTGVTLPEDDLFAGLRAAV